MGRRTKTKRCTRCREVKPLSAFYYHQQRRHYMATCKECNNTACKEYQQNSDYRERPGYVFYQRAYEITRTAKNKGVPVAPAKELKAHLLELWERQGGRCFYTDIAMSMTGYPAQDAMTVDRLVPARGYVPGNVVLCRNIVNRAKQDMEWDELLALGKLFAKNDRRVRRAIRDLEGPRE